MLEEAKLLDEDSDDTARRSWGTSLVVGGEVYATSLFWQPLQNKEDPIVEVAEAAEGILEGADLFCIKPGKAPQFGICVSSEGYRANENAAAVTLATALSDRSSFVAVFKVPEGWWYTCIRNDIILSDGDMLFLNEDEARAQFASMLAVPDWGRKIAPFEWGIEETEYFELEDLFSRGVKAKLQKIKGLRGPKLLAIIGIAAIVGLWLVYSIFDALFLSPAPKPVIAPIAPKAVQPVEKPPEIKPWEVLNDPVAIMSQCYANIQGLMDIMPPGWKMGNISCNAGGATASWTREVGRITWLEKALEKAKVPLSGRSISDDGNSVVVSVPLEGIKKFASPPKFTINTLKETLNDLFQAIGGDIRISQEIYTSPEGTVYRLVKFNFASANNPTVWNDVLTKFSALDISMIKYNTENKTWEYEGAIYAL